MIRKQFWSIALGLLLIGCHIASPMGELRWADSAEAVGIAMNSVVALVQDTPAGPTAPICTASFVGPRLLATAHHCVAVSQTLRIEVTPDLTVKIPNPNAEPIMGREILFIDFPTHNDVIENFGRTAVHVRTATVVQFNASRDIALLSLTEDEPPSAYYFPVSETLPRRGERLYAIGMPATRFWLLTEGIVSSVRRYPGGHVTIIHDAHVSGGASGGPILNNSGQLIGVVTKFVRGRYYIGVATTSLDLLELMDIPRVELGIATITMRTNASDAGTNLWPRPTLEEVPMCELQSCPIPDSLH